MKLSRGRGALAVLIAMFIASAGTPAAAIDPPRLYSFVGTVTDPRGRPIAGAAVAVSGPELRNTTTDDNGNYKADLSKFGEFQIKISKSGINTTSKTFVTESPRDLLADIDVDFQPLYRLDLQLNKSTVSSRSSASVTGLVTTFVPDPHGAPGTAGAVCAYVTSGGVEAAATYQSTSGTATNWQSVEVIDQLRPEGPVQVAAVARDCASGLVLTNSTSRQYTIDNGDPMITAFAPSDRGHTAFTSQPLIIEAKDMGQAGVNTNRTVIRLIDEDGTTKTFSGSSVTWSALHGTFSTLPQTLVPGRRYRLEATVYDNAGNFVTHGHDAVIDGGGFSVVTPDMSEAAAETSIPKTPCSVKGAATDVQWAVECVDVPFRVGDAEVGLAGAVTPGIAVLAHKSSLRTAKILVPLSTPGMVVPPGAAVNHGYVELDAYQEGDLAWADPTLTVPFRVHPAPSSSERYTVPHLNATIPNLTSKLPPGVKPDHVYLQMTPVPSTPVLVSCADPRGKNACGTDPIAVRTADSAFEATSAVANYAPCDSAIQHKVGVTAPVGSDLTVDVAIDASRLAANSVTVQYYVNGGAKQSQTAPLGAGATQATVTLPTASLPEGTVISYRILVAGEHANADCDDLTSIAAAPSNGQWSVLLTANPTAANPAYIRVAGQDIAIGRMQPHHLRRTVTALPSHTAICNEFMKAPTPCGAVQLTDDDEAAVGAQQFQFVEAGDGAGGTEGLSGGSAGGNMSAANAPGAPKPLYVGTAGRKDCVLTANNMTGIMLYNEPTHGQSGEGAYFPAEHWGRQTHRDLYVVNGQVLKRWAVSQRMRAEMLHTSVLENQEARAWAQGTIGMGAYLRLSGSKSHYNVQVTINYAANGHNETMAVGSGAGAGWLLDKLPDFIVSNQSTNEGKLDYELKFRWDEWDASGKYMSPFWTSDNESDPDDRSTNEGLTMHHWNDHPWSKAGTVGFKKSLITHHWHAFMAEMYLKASVKTKWASMGGAWADGDVGVNEDWSTTDKMLQTTSVKVALTEPGEYFTSCP